MSIKEHIAEALAVRREFRKSVFSQALDMLRLSRARGMCGPTDYYFYRMFDPEMMNGNNPNEFAGWRMQTPLSRILNKEDTVLPAVDKITMALFLKNLGLPHPEIIATYREHAPTLHLAKSLSTTEELEAFFKDTSNYPMFAKPARAEQGIGAYQLESYDPSKDHIILPHGKSIAVKKLIEEINFSKFGLYFAEVGYVFQKIITQKKSVSQFLGTNAINGLRIIVLNHRNRSEIFRCVWKLIAGKNVTDHFGRGLTGNMLAAVDIETGKITRVVSGVGRHMKLLENHPTTDKRLLDYQLPDWDEVKSVCLRAARNFPLMRFQHWDVVFSENGPLLLEMNDIGSLRLLQIAYGKGLLEPKIQEMIKTYGNHGHTYWLSRHYDTISKYIKKCKAD